MLPILRTSARPHPCSSWLLLALASLLPARPGLAEEAGAVLVFDQETVPLRAQAPTMLGVCVHVLEPRVRQEGAVTVLRFPVAWKLESGVAPSEAQPRPGRAVIDEPASLELRSRCAELAFSDVLLDQLRRRALPVGIVISPLSPEQETAVLVRESVPTDVGPGPGAWPSLLTRGQARDRWFLRGAGPARPPRQGDAVVAVNTAPAELGVGIPDRVLQLDLVALALHEEGSSYLMPSPLTCATLRVRLWNLGTGARDWDRMFLIARPPQASGLPESSEIKWLLHRAADQVAAALWPASVPGSEVAQLLPATGASGTKPEPAAPIPDAGAPEGSRAASLPEAASTDTDEQLRQLLARFAASRLKAPPAGEPWAALARAVESELPEGSRLALRCADDPVGEAVDLAAERLDLSPAAAHARIDANAALRNVLAADLTRRLVALAGTDQALKDAAPILVGRLSSEPPSAEQARIAAAPLLERARTDGARSPGTLAALLLACRMAPDRAVEALQALLSPKS